MSLDDAIAQIPKDYVFWWVILFVFFIVICIKYIPKIVRWFVSTVEKVKGVMDLASKIQENSQAILKINQRLDRDYERLNNIEKITKQQQSYIEDSVEERELTLRSLLAIVQGLQEIGSNGPTKEAEKNIQNYLLNKAHKMNKNDAKL